MTRTIETTIYTAAELAELHPTAFERAHARYVCWTYDDPAWASEHRDSLRRALAALPGDAPTFDLATHADDVRRCMAWVENNILAKLRIGDLPIGRRKETSKYGSGYRPGMVRPCPWTGFYVDDALIEFIKKEARDGQSPSWIHKNLPAEAERLWKAELEDQTSVRAFLEAAEANGWEFTKQGTMA